MVYSNTIILLDFIASIASCLLSFELLAIAFILLAWMVECGLNLHGKLKEFKRYLFQEFFFAQSLAKCQVKTGRQKSLVDG